MLYHIIFIVFETAAVTEKAVSIGLSFIEAALLKFPACLLIAFAFSLQKRIRVILFPIYFQRLLHPVRPMRRFRHLLFRQKNVPHREV